MKHPCPQLKFWSHKVMIVVDNNFSYSLSMAIGTSRD